MTSILITRDVKSCALSTATVSISLAFLQTPRKFSCSSLTIIFAFDWLTSADLDHMMYMWSSPWPRPLARTFTLYAPSEDSCAVWRYCYSLAVCSHPSLSMCMCIWWCTTLLFSDIRVSSTLEQRQHHTSVRTLGGKDESSGWLVIHTAYSLLQSWFPSFINCDLCSVRVYHSLCPD